jgi:predicted outer membrane protein
MNKDKMQALKQAMQTNKMAFDYNYTMMMTAYEQNKLMFHMFLNQSTDDIPAETKSAIEEWLQSYRKGCDDLKRMTDDGYGLVEKSISSVKI